MPKDAALRDIAIALGDQAAAELCRQALLEDVIVGKNMCG